MPTFLQANIDYFIGIPLVAVCSFIAGALVLAFFSNKAHDAITNVRYIFAESRMIKTLRSEITTLKSQNEQLKESNTKLAESNVLLRDQNDSLNRRFEEQEKAIKQLRDEIEELKKKIQ